MEPKTLGERVSKEKKSKGFKVTKCALHKHE